MNLPRHVRSDIVADLAGRTVSEIYNLQPVPKFRDEQTTEELSVDGWYAAGAADDPEARR